MTVIRPNSISGVSSITGSGGDIKVFRADGTAADVTVNNITSGIITATSFKGDGSNLTGIDASSIKNGSDVKVQANASGAVVTGILTTTSPGDGVGKILQVQSTLLTSVFTLSGQTSGGVDDLTGLSVNITPTRANSKNRC